MRTSSACLALVLGLTLALGGCGSKDTAGTVKARTAGPARKAASPADALSPHLVGAVVTGKAGASLVQVKFELAARPDVGDPVDVDLVIVPAADTIDRLSGSVQADDGLEVVDGATIAPTDKPAFGMPIHHPIKVVARRDGIFTLTANLSIRAAGESLAPIYSMPIIAGNGLVDTGTAPPPSPSAPRPAPTAAAQ